MQTDIGLREALENETNRQKRSYRRATMLIVLVALIGAVWLAFSVINVLRLERRGALLKGEIAALQTKSTELKQTIENQTLEIEKKKKEIEDQEAALIDAQKNIKEGRPQEALRVVSNAINARKARADNSARGVATNSDKSSGTAPSMPSTDQATSVVVPNLLGKTFAQARDDLKAVGLEHETAGEAERNIVIKQTPQAGTKVPKGSKVHLWFRSRSNPAPSSP